MKHNKKDAFKEYMSKNDAQQSRLGSCGRKVSYAPRDDEL